MHGLVLFSASIWSLCEAAHDGCTKDGAERGTATLLAPIVEDLLTSSSAPLDVKTWRMEWFKGGKR